MNNMDEVREQLGIAYGLLERTMKVISAICEEEVGEIKSTLAPVKSPVAKKEEAPKKISRKEREAAEEIPAKLTRDSLAGLSYNTLKRLAKDMGIKAVGGREDLTKAILDQEVTVPKEEVAEVEEEPVKNKVVKKPLKSVKKAEPDEEGDEDDEGLLNSEENSGEEADNEEDGEEEVSDLEKRVQVILEDASNEEIADFLTECGIPAKGKRQALIDTFIKGVEDGIIDLDELESSDETDEEVEAEVSDDEEQGEEADSSEEDEEVEADTKKRKKALKDLSDSIEAEFESGDISRQQMVEEINYRLGTKKRLNNWSDEEVVAKYIELQKVLVDDDGCLNELESPYVLRGANYCCGEPLQEIEGGYKCNVCGNEYGESDEEE